MPRSLLQNVTAYDFEAKVGLKLGSARQTITSTYNFAQDQPVQGNFIASGGNQTIVLPSILGTSFPASAQNGGGAMAQDKKLQIIANVGTSNYLNVVEHADDGSSAVVNLAPGQAAILISDLPDDKWIVLAMGVSAFTQAASLTAVTTTQPTITAFGFTTTAQFNALINDVNSLIAAMKAAGLMVSP
jgi:hypothetical protein